MRNPKLFTKLHFTAKLPTDKGASELNEGEIWRRSPLFTSATLACEALDGMVKIKHGDCLSVRLHGTATDFRMWVVGIATSDGEWHLEYCLLSPYNSLNVHIRSKLASAIHFSTAGADQHLVLSIDTKFLALSAIRQARHITVKFIDGSTFHPPDDQYVVQFLYNERNDVRNVHQRHYFPFESAGLAPSNPTRPYFLQEEQDEEPLKIFLDIFADNFGALDFVYHPLGGVYLTLGNMCLDDRKSLKNLLLYGFSPDKLGNVNFLEPLFKEALSTLQEPFMVRCADGRVHKVVVSCGLMTCDMPEGNDMLESKRQGANVPCRSCFIPKTSLNEVDFDIVTFARYEHTTNRVERDMRMATTKSDLNDLECAYGFKLNAPSIKKYFPLFCSGTMCPFDPYHSEVGVDNATVMTLISHLNGSGIQKLSEVIMSICKHLRFTKLQNLSHFKCYRFIDTIHLIMVIPYALQWLSSNHVKQGHDCSLLVRYTRLFAKACVKNFYVYAKYASPDTIDRKIREHRGYLRDLFGETQCNLPNFHAGLHHAAAARSYGSLLNVTVGQKEARHKGFRRWVRNTNFKDLDRSLMLKENVMSSFRFLADGGLTRDGKPIAGRMFSGVFQFPTLRGVLGSFLTQDTDAGRVSTSSYRRAARGLHRVPDAATENTTTPSCYKLSVSKVKFSQHKRRTITPMLRQRMYRLFRDNGQSIAITDNHLASVLKLVLDGYGNLEGGDYLSYEGSYFKIKDILSYKYCGHDAFILDCTALEPTGLKDLLTKSSVFLAKGEEEDVLLIVASTKWKHGVSAKNFSDPNEIPLAFIPFPDAVTVWTTVDTAAATSSSSTSGATLDASIPITNAANAPQYYWKHEWIHSYIW